MGACSHSCNIHTQTNKHTSKWMHLRKNNYPRGRECLIKGQMKFLNFILCTWGTCHKINIFKVNTVHVIIEINSYKQFVGRVVADIVYSPKRPLLCRLHVSCCPHPGHPLTLAPEPSPASRARANSHWPTLTTLKTSQPGRQSQEKPVAQDQPVSLTALPFAPLSLAAVMGTRWPTKEGIFAEGTSASWHPLQLFEWHFRSLNVSSSIFHVYKWNSSYRYPYMYLIINMFIFNNTFRLYYNISTSNWGITFLLKFCIIYSHKVH